MTHHSFFIARYLTDRLMRIMILYLAYVRPFANMIYNQIIIFPNMNDSDYIFCSDKSSMISWDGRILSRTLQVTSQAKLRIKINIWTYRQIVIGIAKIRLKSIAPFWEKDEKRCHQLLMQNVDRYIYVWQADHQLIMNMANYGLKYAYPSSSARITARISSNLIDLALLAWADIDIG